MLSIYFQDSPSGIVNGFNNMGIAVGEATNSNPVCGLSILDPVDVSTAPVIWGPDGRVVDLNTIIIKRQEHYSSSISSLASALAINDYGQILTAGVDRMGKFHEYLLSVSENGI